MEKLIYPCDRDTAVTFSADDRKVLGIPQAEGVVYSVAAISADPLFIKILPEEETLYGKELEHNGDYFKCWRVSENRKTGACRVEIPQSSLPLTPNKRGDYRVEALGGGLLRATFLRYVAPRQRHQSASNCGSSEPKSLIASSCSPTSEHRRQVMDDPRIAVTCTDCKQIGITANEAAKRVLNAHDFYFTLIGREAHLTRERLNGESFLVSFGNEKKKSDVFKYGFSKAAKLLGVEVPFRFAQNERAVALTVTGLKFTLPDSVSCPTQPQRPWHADLDTDGVMAWLRARMDEVRVAGLVSSFELEDQTLYGLTLKRS